MARYIEGVERHQVTLFPACMDDFIPEDSPKRVADAWVDELDLAALGFAGAATGRPGYHPATRQNLLRCRPQSSSLFASRVEVISMKMKVARPVGPSLS